MRILHKRWDVQWSWTQASQTLSRELSQHEWHNEGQNGGAKDEPYYDIFLTQTPMLVNRIISKSKVIARLGANNLYEPGRYDMSDIITGMKECFAIIATDKFLYEKAKEYNKNVFLIPNGLNLDDWDPVPAKKGFTAGFVANITTAEMREYKGYDFVEQACAKLKVPLLTGLYRDNQIPYEEMREKFYAQIHVLVHPTKGEGCSNTIMEALACGIPVITTKAAGFHGERLVDGTDVLFCERSIESVLDCLKKLKRSKRLRDKLSRNGRKFAAENHDIRKIAREYDKIFQACYDFNKAKTKVEANDRDIYVKVRAKEPIYEEGNRAQGAIFSLSLFRVKQLGDLVEILNG